MKDPGVDENLFGAEGAGLEYSHTHAHWLTSALGMDVGDTNLPTKMDLSRTGPVSKVAPVAPRAVLQK